MNSSDPIFLYQIKETKNTIEVPQNWEYKKKKFAFKRGLLKQIYKLPHNIEETGIGQLRDPMTEKSTIRMLRLKMKERMNPRLGRIDIDYQVLYDAFFKYQT